MIPLQRNLVNAKLSAVALFALGCFSSLINSDAQAQNYTLIDLTPKAGNAAATGVVEGIAAG